MIAWLFDTVLYTGALIALVLGLRRPVGRFFGPQLAYGLWALPFLRLLLPPIVLPADMAPAPVPAAAPALAFEPVAVVETTPELAAPLTAEPAFPWADLLAPALSLWAGVALAFLAWRMVSYRRMRRDLLAAARPVGEIGAIRLVETPALAAPVAFGVFDKVIALPPGFMAQVDLRGRDLAIAHEQAHHRGHDLLANMLAQALLALHWFNPLAWLGWRAMRRDQEAACDARVLTGRGQEERVHYATLIAGVAAGPRLALAAPMACPVLGDRSIVHRLRSMSMSETSRRRRWLGRTLVGAGALALPLTASISYAAAQDAPEPPVAPVAPTAPYPPEAPTAPEGVAPIEHRTYVVRREGPDGQPIVRRFAFNVPPGAPNPPRPPQLNGDPDSPEFEREMERFEREMERFEAEVEAHEDEWERLGEEAAELGEAHRVQALALADHALRVAPEVVESCDGDGNVMVRNTPGANGRQRIVICQQAIQRTASRGVRRARESIANNPEIREEVRREVLEELDSEIERIEREED